jgi:hypothetical protein
MPGPQRDGRGEPGEQTENAQIAVTNGGLRERGERESRIED